ncbi:hypothetical protein DRO34_00665 [Candidatus Bathyarchaeota archaeon]|nr:MAG: hypothetical protein DRO34_00665 [Candidatus Bathyarchaeota archaeon]
MDNRVSIGELIKPRRRKPAVMPKEIAQIAKELEGTLEAVLLDKEMKPLARLPVSELAEKLQEMNGVDTVVFDGVITQRMVDIASEKNIRRLVAARISEVVKQPLTVQLVTFSELARA